MIMWNAIDEHASFCQVFPKYYVVKGKNCCCIVIGEQLENDDERLKGFAWFINFTPKCESDARLFGLAFAQSRNGGRVFDLTSDEIILATVEKTAADDLIEVMLRLGETKASQPKVEQALKPFLAERWIKPVGRALYLRTHNYKGALPTDKEELRNLAINMLRIESLAQSQKGAVIKAFKETNGKKHHCSN